MTWGRRARWALALVGTLGVTQAAAEERDDARDLAELVLAWGRTEDAGDLPGYAALLAPEFRSTVGPGATGGVGPAGWLAGVRGRFEARARVGADAPELARGHGTAVARVGLVRGAGSTREASEAWLWLVEGPAGWRVAGAEEARAGARRSRRAPEAERLPLRLVVHAGAPHLLIAPARSEHLSVDPGAPLAEAAEGWRAWPLAEPDDDGDLASWRGRSLVLHDADGPLCRGVAEQSVVLVREPTDPDAGAAPATGLDLARVWAGAPGGGAAFLALRVSTLQGDPCRGATWAHLDDQPPERLAPWAVPSAVRRAGLVALRKLAAYRAAARAVEAEGHPGVERSRGRARRPRWELAPEARLEVRGFGPAVDGARYLGVSAAAPGQPWAGVAALWQVYEADAEQPHLVLISDADGPARPFAPQVAVRLPGWRDPAFIGDGRLLAPAGRWLREHLDTSPPLYAFPPRGGSTTTTPSDTLGPRSKSAPSTAVREKDRHVRPSRSP